MGATNRPWELDAAIGRRFEKRINVPLPDAAARTEILSRVFSKARHNLTPTDFMEIGAVTAG